MRLALGDVKKVDYINTHGTSTPVGDVVEIALKMSGLWMHLPCVGDEIREVD